MDTGKSLNITSDLLSPPPGNFISSGLFVCLFRLLHLCVVHDQYNEANNICGKKVLVFEDKVEFS